ncbi:MAG: hypothetical protein WC810_18690 [Janthinobacterium sp.]|jgi:hypothetical protein
MGRKSRVPTKIQSLLSNEVTISSEGDLPPILPFIDIQNGKSGNNMEITRFYLHTPTLTEALVAKKLGYVLVGGNSGRTGIKSIAIGDYAKEKISELFGQQLSQLIINALARKKLSKSSIETLNSSIKHFINYLSSTKAEDLGNFSIYSIKYDDWKDYCAHLEISDFKAKNNYFISVRSIFSAFEPTSIFGSINRITPPNNKRKVISDEHTLFSFKEVGAYSDAVMYQLLALFIFRFKRQIKYLKYYEELCIDSMGKDWIYPGRNSVRLKDLNKKRQTDNLVIIDQWLSDIKGYKRILDHKLMWYKLGCRAGKTFVEKIHCFMASSESLKEKYAQYKLWEKETHFLDDLDEKNDIFGLYVKRSVSEDKTGSMNQLAFCLANIVMIYTGLNKEVVLSWPSIVNNKSILDQKDNLFIRDDGHDKEIVISGTKSRTGILTKDKTIRIAIVIGSPLFVMLREYEKHAKHNKDKPFFEFSSTSFARSWGGCKAKFKKYPVMDDNGQLIHTLNTAKFRKVFASTKMLEHLKGIKNSQDLANRLQSDLDHNNFDVTLSHYLLRSQNATSALDLAIVVITTEKIRQALEFQGVIAISQKPKNGRSVYLCECADPLNPTHGFAIAKKCTYYDLCLGCKQSIIFKMHLPYICFRILQYEARRDDMGNEWSAIFEDKWMIANDALNKYKNQDRENGEQLIKDAWLTARSNDSLLPPIIMSKF